MELIHTALFLPSLFFFFFLALKIINSKHRQKECVREPPGPWTLPILGSLHHMVGSKLPHYSFRDLSAVYGPIMRLKLGEIHVVVISSADGAREIMKTHDIVFASRPINKSIDVLFYGGNDIIFGPYGEFWRQLRRICTLELLNTKRVQSFRAVREDEVTHLLQSLAASSGVEISLRSKLTEISHNVIARAVIGGRFGDQELFFSVLNGAVELISGFTVVDLFPSLPFLGRITGVQRRLEQCKRKLDLILEKIIEEHVEKMSKNSLVDNDEEPLCVEDLTDVLLRLQREGNFQIPLSNDNIKAVINDMLMAGSETTSTTMEWAMSELVRNPEIMKKAQSEVREVLKESSSKTLVIKEELMTGRLTYLSSVINETLRLHPPAPLILPRINQEDFEVMGYMIPAGSTVMVNAWAIGRDPKKWKEPEAFRPERFDGEEDSLDQKRTNFEFIPFGAGRRSCPGIQFGMSTMETTLAYLLYYFDWKYVSVKGEELDMAETLGVTIRRKNPLCLIATPHFPLSVV